MRIRKHMTNLQEEHALLIENHAKLEKDHAAALSKIAALEKENAELRTRLDHADEDSPLCGSS